MAFRRSRIIFINRFFYPDYSATSQLLSELAFGLAKRGFRITIITSRQSYETPTAPLLRRECISKVHVWRVWTSRRGRQRLFGRSLDYLTFYVAAGWRVWQLARPKDIIVAKTDPPMLSTVIAPVARLRKAYLVNWLQDIFPEIAEALNIGGSLGRRAAGVLRPLRNWSLRSAETNVVVGQSMSTHLKKLGITPGRIRVVSNWSDGNLIAPVPGTNELRGQWVPKDHFVVGYAGNLGLAHDFDTIVEAMRLLHERATNSAKHDITRVILFIFVGGGAQRVRLEQEVIQRRINNVRFHPYQPRERLAEALCLADVHLVSLHPSLEGLIVPSKFYAVAAAARPTIFIGEKSGEIARLLQQFECGFTVNPGDGIGLVNRILQLVDNPQLCTTMGARARAAFEEHWDKSIAIDKWERIFRAIMNARTSESAAARQA
jgi:colanic acid biosynthesis glycosyl transferase WcaI